LLEPSRTNRLNYSEDFSQWTLVGDSIVKTDEKAFGKNIWRLTETSAGFLGIFKSCQETGLFETTISVLAKPNTSNQLNLRFGGANNKNLIIDLSDGSVTGKSSGITEHIKNMGNGWYLVSSTITLLNTNVDVAVYTNSGSIDIIFAQEEAGSYPTSYIPTQGSTVTRLDDSCLQGGFQNKNIFGSTQGSVVFEFKWDASNYVFDFNDSSGRRIRIFRGTTSWQIRDFSGSSWISNGFTKLSNVKTKIGFKWNGTEFTAFQDGVKSSSTDSFASSMSIESITANKLNNTSNMQFYNTALTDQELIALTTI